MGEDRPEGVGAPLTQGPGTDPWERGSLPPAFPGPALEHTILLSDGVRAPRPVL